MKNVGLWTLMTLHLLQAGLVSGEEATNVEDAQMPAPRIEVTTDKDSVALGGSASLEIRVLDGTSGKPLASCLLLAYVDGRRWGAHEVTDGEGRARIILPFPNQGLHAVQVRAVAGFRDTCIVWTENSASKKSFMATRFREERAVASARVRASANHRARILLNGQFLTEVLGTGAAMVTDVDSAVFRDGENVWAVEAENEAGIAGVMAQLEYVADGETMLLVTGRDWQAWESAPPGWPEPDEAGEPVRVPGRLQDAIWSEAQFEEWPGAIRRDQLFAGRPLPEGAMLSSPVQVEVTPRQIPSRRDPEHLIGMQWGSYFFKEMFYWHNTQAVPMVGLYESYNRDVIRQHALWLMDMGVDFLFADWPHHVPEDAGGNQHWKDRLPAANGQMHCTQMMLEVHAQLRDEGYPAPQLVIMPFLANGPGNSPETVNEQLEWLHNYFIRNARFEGLWVMVEGKPLVVLLHNTLVPAWEAFDTPIDETYFTVRYMGAQLQETKMDKHGYWSWMDGIPDPIVTFRDGVAEVCTPSAGFFNMGMWLADDAWGHRNGASLVRTFQVAMEHRPRFVLLHQWNEFTGQLEGYPYPGGIYGDSYSVEFSDDIEPVSLTADGYRGDDGGWGFYYHNVAQALVTVYKEREPEDTVLAVYPPAPGQVVCGDRLEVQWVVAGKAPGSYALLLDGTPVTSGLRGNAYRLPLSGVPEGEHVLSVIAEGAQTHYRLARDEADARLEKPIPVRSDTPFFVRKQ